MDKYLQNSKKYSCNEKFDFTNNFKHRKIREDFYNDINNFTVTSLPENVAIVIHYLKIF